MDNWRRYPSSNWYEIDQKRGSKFGAVVAPSDATEKNCNMGAQLQSILYTTAQNISENLLHVRLFVRTNLFIPSRFWTTHTKIDNYLLLLSALYSKGGNFFILVHICMHSRP